MAKTGKTAQEFMKDSFSPNVAVLCSPKVDYVVSKNNLTFTELLQPFTAMDWEGQLKEPGGGSCCVKNWKLIMRDVNWKPLQPTEARRQLNNAVHYNYHDKTVSLEFDGRKFDIPQSTYWFDAWRETYLEVQFPSDHEFTKHFLSCIIVGVAHDDNVIDSFNSLNQQYAQLQNVAPPKLPKWFNNGVLKSYLLLHDASVISRDKADVTFELLKETFGASNCFILSINSKSASDPFLADMWAPFVKRTTDSNNDNASLITQPTTPAEPQLFPQTTANLEDGTMSASVQADNSHPLTSPDNDMYDNANSLQTHSFSGSAESVSVTSKGLDLSTEVHGTSLNVNDIDDIKKFLQDYAQKTLLPHIEKQIAQLSEVVANRKGVSRSLLSATKRWFGTGKTGGASGNNTVIYTNDCPELQLRRLGDLWFMCGQWQRAFDAYHTAKREFYADSAWLFYAGALEMAAISAFMAGDANKKTHGYMEESIVTYLNTCRMVQYAVRATLLSVLCLNSAGLHGEAAKQLIRMTSEDSDLRSAMLLEQASLCFLSGPGTKAMCRKYAFHMVLAGHRFSKAGQKKHAYRCYKQAYQVYGSSGWRLATDHVQFALGRLAGALKQGSEALQWLAAPLAPPPPGRPSPLNQHHAFLREYMLAHQQWLETSEEFKDRQRLPYVPVPLVEVRSTAVVMAGPAPLSSPGRRAATSLSVTSHATPTVAPHPRVWHRLEEMLLQVVQGAVPMIFKPTVDLYDDSTDCDPIVPQGEPTQISITLWNPLHIVLLLKDVELLWKFVSKDNPEEVLDNESAVASGNAMEATVIFGQKIKSTLLEANTKKVLTFTLTPMKVGTLSVHGLAYKLVNVGEGGNENGNGVTIAGKLNLTTGVKSTDRRLQITVIPEAPCLQMTFSETNPNIISGEMRTIDVEFTNVGPVEMKNLHIAVSHPDVICLDTLNDDGLKLLYDDKYREPPNYSDERSGRAAMWRALAARHVRRASGGRATLAVRAHAAAPAPALLAYYETGLRDRPYRLLRHVFHFNVTEAVEVSVSLRRNLNSSSGNIIENMNLAVEAKNTYSGDRNDVTVELLDASLLSRQWQLTHLLATGSKNEPLVSRERLHLVLKARRILETLTEGKVDHSNLRISDLEYQKYLSKIPPFSKFVMDGVPTLCETNDGLILPNKTKPRSLVESMFILRWKVTYRGSGEVAIGQHSLWLECFTRALSRDVTPQVEPTTTLQLDEFDKPDYQDLTKSNKTDNIVIFGLEHSNRVDHNFKERKICLIPVTLNVVNCYGIPVKVFVDMTRQINRECSGEMGWTGALSSSSDADGKVGVSVELAGFECRRVQVRAVCAAPGTYLLGAAFTVTTTEPLHVTRLADNTSLLVVQQAA